MPKSVLRMYLVTLFLVFCASCTQVPSTEDLDSDIAKLDDALKVASEEAKAYSGGLVKVLIEVRKEVLSTTRAMLDQKRSAFKRFVPLAYQVDGKPFNPPQNKEELLKGIRDDIEKTQNDIAEARKENDRYSGGLIKVMILTRIATLDNTLAFLKQRELLLKHDIPYYANLPEGKDDQTGGGFKPTPGKDIEKF